MLENELITPAQRALAASPPLILVVEDNPITLKMVGVTLRVEGYRVQEAQDGKSALELMAQQKPDLILQDLMLPDMHGVELVQHLRGLPGGGEIPIICFSGFISRIEEARVTSAGFTDFLVKPVEPSQLVRTIQTYLPVHEPTGELGQGQRVLIVDDDMVQLKLMSLLFTQHGFTVETAKDGRTALALAEAKPPHIIVSDVLMPGMDGFELCYTLRQHPLLKNIPLLLVSANYVESRDHDFAMRIGANGYLERNSGSAGIIETALKTMRSHYEPPKNLPDAAEIEKERHERVVRQLERQVRLHSSLMQRSTIQSAILNQISIIAESLAKRGNFDTALSDILAYCLDGAGLSRGALYLLEDDTLKLQAHYGFGQSLQQAQTMFSECELCAQAATSGETVVIPNPQLPQERMTRFLQQAGATSALIVPVLSPDKNLGVFVLLSEHRDLTEPDWLAFGRSLATQISQTIALSRSFFQLSESERRFRLLFDGTSDAIVVTDQQLRVIDANPSATRISGYKLDEMRGLSIDILMVPEHLRGSLASAIAEYQITGRLTGEFPLRTRSGEERAVSVTGNRVAPNLYVNICHDITEERRSRDAIQRLAFTDTLTNLPNRTALHARTALAIQAAQEKHEPLALMILDLNDFRQINDTLGHQNGDTLLIQVAGRLKTALWESDMVARLGGDEFGVLLPRLAAAEHIKIVVEKVEQALLAPFLIGGVPLDVQATFGIALYPKHGSDPDTLLRRADMAMYAAKDARKRHIIYDPAIDHSDARQLSLIGELREAIQNDRLVLYYQPKISVQTGRVSGMEALVRWPHAVQGMIFPDQFIPIAERPGLINPLTIWVLGNALRQMRMWRKAGHDFSVAVNLSVRNLQQPGIVAEISDFLRDNSVPPATLTLEVTESAVMVEPELAHHILGELRTLGIRISIDDFGIGYSSLAYLKELPADQLKIDKSFVMEYSKDKRNAAIVHSTIELAHSLGMEVTAEGVEDEKTLQALKTLGCDIAQGYHIGRPMPVSDIGAWLEKWMASVPAAQPPGSKRRARASIK